MSRLWLWSWLCLCVCSLAEDSCSASPRPVSGNCLLQKKGVVKKVAPAHEVLELKKRDDDDDEDGGDDDEEDVPLFDNGPGRSGNGKPLHKCQGSCSDDADCEGDLVCVTPKFVGWDGFVPGCRSGPRGKPLWEFRYCSEKPPDGWRTATTSTTTPEPTPPPPPAPSVITDCPAGGVCARLMAFNVYYAALGREDRMDGIAQAIADVTPDIAVITEQWKEKPTILEKIKQKTNKYYAFCLGGPQEKWWDGDILYRADLFEVVKDSIMDWGANRGLSWAVLKHKDSGKKVIIYGAHPVCCGNEPIHLQNALDFAEHAKTLVAEFPDAAIAYMGDFNALEDWKSTQLYLGAEVTERGRSYKIDFKFRDAFRDVNDAHVDATTHSSGARLDYIFLERGDARPQPISQGFRTMRSRIWRNPGPPGGSDHYPILADVELLG